MTPAARVQSAIEILDDILAGMASEQALTRWARSHRFAGSKDRAAIRDHVFSAIRCKRSYAALGGSLTGRGLMIGAIKASQEPLVTVFDGSNYGPDKLSVVEQQPVSLQDLPVSEQVDLQDWVWEKLQKDLGDRALPNAQCLRERAPVFLRVNLRKSDVSGAIGRLKDEQIEVSPHPLSDTALMVQSNPRRIAQSDVYKTGIVELQDAASQAVCDFLNVPASGSVLDYCAGGGGKSLAIAAKTDAKIVAHDANFSRMSDLPARAKRAGVDVQLVDKISKNKKYDLVFCDVPCSGSGSWRRSPDGKWKLSQSDLDQLHETQANILDTAQSLVNEQGELAYATCSLFHSENRDQVRAFLDRHPNWKLIDDHQFLPTDGGDGFYVARLSRA